ncbi:MAG: hypothetical protein JRC87_06630 [Deltaproteobacteria bacterium]|nr:hypothetical protein [Deltaproteobacteria bacterium]MBW2659254.1 hypothetical protein [Deltaproteobacteria bacterium]
MGNNDLMVNNPLRALGLEDRAGEGVRSMGLVMARAGLGKTAILVQFALDCILQGNRVLHVSIGESVEKTRAWYDDILSLLTEGEKIEMIPGIMKNRMIMTFKESAFSKAILEERFDDLVQQEIFKPECLIIDGYDFENNDTESLDDLRKFMIDRGLKVIWFSAVCHRGDDRVSVDGVPAPCHDAAALFETVLLIDPDGDEIKLAILKCDSTVVDPDATLILDPSTMLVKKS